MITLFGEFQSAHALGFTDFHFTAIFSARRGKKVLPDPVHVFTPQEAEEQNTTETAPKVIVRRFWLLNSCLK